jgi:hypothetical protein
MLRNLANIEILEEKAIGRFFFIDHLEENYIFKMMTLRQNRIGGDKKQSKRIKGRDTCKSLYV